MAMYGNFVATSMGKGQLVKENHVFFFQGNMATVGNTWDTSRDSWDQTKHGRPQAITENSSTGISTMKVNGKDYPGCPIYYGK
jgi:hypothetical protein